MEKEEKLIDIIQAVEAETGRRVHRSTVIRWIKRGVKGVSLESRRVGGRYLTSVAWVRNFVESLSLNANTNDAVVELAPVHIGRQREIEEATSKLAKVTRRADSSTQATDHPATSTKAKS